MKKIIALIVGLGMMTSMLTACGSSAKQNGGQSQNAADAGKTKPVTIQIGYENNPGEPIDLAVKKWKELVEQKSNGSMKVELFPSSQLGSKNDLIDQMIAGSPVITLADGTFYADRGVPDFGIAFGPYFFSSWDQVWKLTKSTWWKEQTDKLEQKGLKMLTADWMYGERHTLTKKPVRTVQDLKGMKIRVPNNTIQIKSYEVIGAAPTPMALGEVYTALQQGVIDGVENPLSVLYNGKFQEVAKYLTLDGHIKNATTWITGTTFFKTLTPDQQKILMETGDEAGLYNNDLQKKVDEEMLQKFKEAGVEIINVDVSKFAEASKAFYTLPEFTSKWSPRLYDKVQAAMK